MKITREMLIEEGYCADTPGKLEQYVPPEGLTPLQVCDADVPVYDKIWCLLRRYGDHQPLTDRQCRLLACKWAREARARAAWDDARSLRAIDVSEKFADGLASKDELEAARSAAQSAAWEAWESWQAWEAWKAWSARSAAASAAAMVARVAALDAAMGAVLDAARSAASSAAWSAMGAVPDARADAHSRHLADIRDVLNGELFAENIDHATSPIKPNKKGLAGRLVGHLSVLKCIPGEKYYCKCSCGEYVTINGSSLYCAIKNGYNSRCQKCKSKDAANRKILEKIRTCEAGIAKKMARIAELKVSMA